MSDLVSIAGTAASAYQRALGVVSNNIANVGSAGYTKQEADLIENTPRSYGTSFLGTGVNFTGVRRAYDEFVENTLRSATSDLESQVPLLNYANRVVNILGSEDAGLLSAFDQFFDAARQLSTDSSSLILRNQFLSKADGLSSRFQTLHGQLDLVEKETREALQTELQKLNNLSTQLATINGQLMKTKFKERQPSALLDQRDQVLREMSEVIKLNVTELINGQVTVSVGSSANRGVIVSESKALSVSAVFNETAPEKLDLVINPGLPSNELIAGFSGGSVAGIYGFRSNLLGPTYDELDGLAKSVVETVNSIHREGLDLQGTPGVDLFKIDPQFSVQALSGQSDTQVDASLVNLEAFNNNELTLQFREDLGQVNDLSLSGNFEVGDQIVISLNGLSRSLTLTAKDPETGDRLPDGTPIQDLSIVTAQLRTFLEGGQRLSPSELVAFYTGDSEASLEGAFGRQISVEVGAGNDLLVSSDILGAFNLSVQVYSQSGSIDNKALKGQWQVTDELTGQVVFGPKQVDINGIHIDLSGDPIHGEILSLKVANSAASGIRLAIDDPQLVASAARFRVIENQFNPSGSDARLVEVGETYPDEETLILTNLLSDDGETVLDNNSVASEAIDFDRIKPSPLTVVPAGYQDTVLFLGELNDQPIDLQVFTRDGRHLLGRQMADSEILIEEDNLNRELSDEELALVIDRKGEYFLGNAKLAGAGFLSDATYSAAYLNVSGDGSYRDMDMFYGVRSDPNRLPILNLDHVFGSEEVIDAELISTGILDLTGLAIGDDIFSNDDLRLNGQSLTNLKIGLKDYGFGPEPVLVVERQLYDGKVISKVLDYPRPEEGDLAEDGSQLYNVGASHYKAWLDAQEGFGVGEQQFIKFDQPREDGTITITVPAALDPLGGSDLEIEVVVTVDSEPSTIASQVAEALGQLSFITDYSGRSVHAYEDGTVLIEYAVTDQDVDELDIDVGDSKTRVEPYSDPFRSGVWAQGEEQKIYLQVPEGDFSGGPITIEVMGQPIALDGTEATALEVSEKIRDALMTPGSIFLEASPLRRVIVGDDGSITFRFPPGDGEIGDKLEFADPDGAQILLARNDAVTGETISAREITSLFSGLSIGLQQSENSTALHFRQPYVSSTQPEDSQIRLGLGQHGYTTDLSRLGFRTGVYIQGEVKEDLLVFASLTNVPNPETPEIPPSQEVSYTLGATYREGSRDPVETLREEPFEVRFVSDTSYEIVDLNTDTIVAEREYDALRGIQYRGIALFLNQAASGGDRFLVDGNDDGIGNNANIVRIADLQNSKIVGGGDGLTFSEYYDQIVTEAGSTSFQASIASKALEVVKDQAVQARDKISGVSLDEEAADLIRFQQAYQANAKVMQTASTLFDAILAVR